MDKLGKFNSFTLRILGAILGALGFILLAYQKQLLGTVLIGMGSVLIAAGGG